MKTKILILAAIFSLGFTLPTEAQLLGKLKNSATKQAKKAAKDSKGDGSKIGSFKSTSNKAIAGKKVYAPYTNIYSFQEYIDGEDKENQMIDGEKTIRLYMWIPVAANEIGIRMISPASRVKAKNPVATEAFAKNATVPDQLASLDLKLEKANIISTEKITAAESANWTKIETTRPTTDAYQLNNQYSNTGFKAGRAVSNSDDALGALTRGLYRIDMIVPSIAKSGKKGTLLAQIGFPVKIPGVVIAKSIEELTQAINN